jgi:hypothetical protein
MILPQDIKFNRYQRESLNAQKYGGAFCSPRLVSTKLREESKSEGNTSHKGDGRRKTASGASGRNSGDGGV